MKDWDVRLLNNRINQIQIMITNLEARLSKYEEKTPVGTAHKRINELEEKIKDMEINIKMSFGLLG